MSFPPGGHQDLQQSHDRLAAVFAKLAVAVTVTDDEGRIVDANPAAAALLGFERAEDMLSAAPGEITSRYILLEAEGGLVSGEQLPNRRVTAGEETAEVLLRIVERETGDERWRLVRSTPIVDAQQRRFAVTVTEDVTEAKEAELRQAFLARAGEVLSSSLDYMETLRRVGGLAVPTLADWCRLDILDDRGLRQQVGVFHQDPAKLVMARELNDRYPPDPSTDSGVYGVLRTGEPELYPHLTDEMLAYGAIDDDHLTLLRTLGMRSLMFVPMRIRERTIGAITFVSAETQRAFDDADLSFAMELARRAATAVENARLYTSRTEAARTLQQTLLPEKLIQPSGWLAASSYRPGDDLNEVGGDFFDLIELPDGSWLAFIGDVTGKGVKAAALTSLARHTLQVGARFDPRPRALMRLLEDVVNDRPEFSPITVACVRVTGIDEGAVATVTCAGHPPPLLLRPGAAPQPIGLTDVLLGAGVGSEWNETDVPLRPGDTLLLYTDGIPDTPGDAARFGEARLVDTAADGPLDPSSVLARLDAATLAWQSGRAVDDRAMLALQLIHPSGRTPVESTAGGASAG